MSMIWIAFGAGVAATLTLEFALAHFFLWRSKRGVAQAEAIVQGTHPWVEKAEKWIDDEEKRAKVFIEGSLLNLNGNANTTAATLPVGDTPTPVPDITVSSPPAQA